MKRFILILLSLLLLSALGCAGQQADTQTPEQTKAPTAAPTAAATAAPTAAPAANASAQQPEDAQAESSQITFSDIAYASQSEAQKLDILLPEGEGPFPLVLLVHGGGFKFGDKQMDIVKKMFALTDAGYAVATVNYRLSGEAVFPAAVADVKAAVRFLRANATAYDIDTERFGIWGESAGAYLAVMTAVTDDTALTGDVTDNAGVSSSVGKGADRFLRPYLVLPNGRGRGHAGLFHPYRQQQLL